MTILTAESDIRIGEDPANRRQQSERGTHEDLAIRRRGFVSCRKFAGKRDADVAQPVHLPVTRDQGARPFASLGRHNVENPAIWLVRRACLAYPLA